MDAPIPAPTTPASTTPAIPTAEQNQQALDDLVNLLDLEAIEVNLFRGASTDEERVRVFGGQVAGQALIAASRTVDEPGRHVHSLHAYFLRPGDPKRPILYEVDRIRDGRSFSTRRVVAVQHGKAIFNLQASFHDEEAGGPNHQLEMDDGMTPPEELPDFHTRMAPHAERIGAWYHRPRPIDLRYVDGDPMSRQGESNTGQHVWLRANGVLPDDPVLQACVLTYASDMTLLDTTLLPFGLAFDHPGLQMASLDHAMWFHRPFQVDEWLLYQQQAISTGGARGLAGGAIFTADGQLAVSVVQEGLARFTQ
ncbi:MAG: acyl-CoA thioesterase [Ilumatobacter sp.]|jgi:acyl-CoA thioesterase II|uniref:acyl-CoA thioesterase n=1 Tax=Ilumatobacter sp. TaxID=1967498 RepID=UPI00391CEC5F